MKFCPKCGVSVKDEAKFCNKCGYDFNLNESQNTENDSSNSEEEVEEETPAFKYTLSGTNKKILLGSVIAAVLIISFVFSGKMLSNPKRTVMVFENAVNKDNAEMISKVLYSSDGRLKFTSDGVKPLIQAFKTTPSEFTDVISNLNNQASNLKNGGIESKTSSLYITRSGRMMLFFPKYKIAANPVFLTVTSGVKGADILIDGQKVAVTDSENFSRQLGPYLPGLYNVEGKAKGAFGEMDNITKVDFIKDKEQNKAVNALEGIYLQVNSSYNNNKIYINGKDTGKSVNAGDKIGPVASGASIYGVINYNGQKFKSSAYNLSDDDTSIDFDYSSNGANPDQQQDDINNMIISYSSALASTLTYGDTSQLVDYMYPGSKLYKQQIDNVNSYYKSNQNFYEKYDSAVVNSYKMNPDGKSGTVDATEVYDINEHYNDFDSQFSTKTFENVYNFKYNDTAKAYQLTERVSAVEK